MLFQKGSSQAVGIDIGSYAIKIVGLVPGQVPQMRFYSILTIPEKAEEAFLMETVMRVLKEHNCVRSDIHVTVSDESVHIRRLELPPMPRHEMLEALKWKAKDRIPFDIEKSVVDFRQLQELERAHGAKVADVMFVAALRDTVEKRIGMLRKLNLSVVSVNVSSFSLENVLALQDDVDTSHTVLLVDVGHKKTDISFYKNKLLQFVRTIPIASGDITTALCGPVTIGIERKGLSREEAEEIKRQLGIPYELLRLEKGITSIQVMTMIRGILERFSKEIKRSIEYYLSEISGEGVLGVYLTGGGSRLINLDKYLGEQLNLPVKRMGLPPRVEAPGPAISQDDALSITGALGAALDADKGINLLPQEYRTEKVELMQKISIRLISIVLGLLLGISYVAVKFNVDDYARRVKNAELHKGVLAKVRALNEKIRERERMIDVVNKRGLEIDYIMKVLSNIIPAPVVLNNMRLDPKSKVMDITGLVYEKGTQAETTLTKFMEELEKSRCFKDAQLTSIQGGQSQEAPASAFTINCQLE